MYTHNHPVLLPANLILILCRAVAHVNSAGGRSQRASARSLAVAALPADPIVLPEVAASSSHPLSDFDPHLLPVDSEDAVVSRATSFHEDSPPAAMEPAKRNRGRPNKDKGKGKEREREMVIKVKEEPVVVSLSGELASLGVRPLSFLNGLDANSRPVQRGPLLCVSVSRRVGVL